MPQIFYVIRHAETEWNVLRRLQGHSDIPLNAKGREQAQQLKQRLKGLKVDQVVSSDLCRAAETGQIALEQEMVLTPGLREVFLGRAEGATWDSIQQSEGEVFWNSWGSHHPDHLDLRFPEGESKREMLARILECFRTHLTQHPEKTLAFVSHGLVMRSLTHYLRPGLEDTHFIANCGVLKLSFSPPGEFTWLEYFEPTREVT